MMVDDSGVRKVVLVDLVSDLGRQVEEHRHVEAGGLFDGYE